MRTNNLEIHVGLVHYPVFNRVKQKLATNITNFDIHDIARVCRCYGVSSYTLIHPSDEQLMFVERLKEHWLVGQGKSFNPLRSEALAIVQTAKSIQELVQKAEITSVFGTSARVHESYPLKLFSEMKAEIESDQNKKLLLLFGTGFGLTPEVYEQCDALLEPIQGSKSTDFRHLSVRSAVGIILDRLVGS